MVEYRAYTVDQDGRILGVNALVCSDDAEAIEQAKRLVLNYAIELWSGTRLVTRLEPKTK
jgi:predicted dinucleotide-binding enzyme